MVLLVMVVQVCGGGGVDWQERTLNHELTRVFTIDCANRAVSSVHVSSQLQ